MSKLIILVEELLLFFLVQLLGIFTASKLIISSPEILHIPQISLITFAGIFLMSVIFIFLAMRFVKHKSGFKILFIFLIIVGSKTIFSAFFSDLLSNILALLMVALWVFIPYVITHNFVLIFAIAGISTELGFSLSFATILILLSILI